MRPDPGLDVLERLQRDLPPTDRALLGQELRERGLGLVWDQVDRAEPMTPVDESMFILDRLYPEMPQRHRASFRRQIEVACEAGDWRGFERPARRLTPD